MKKVYLLLILLLQTTLLFSQENKKPVYIISGKVIDVETKKPLEYATVVFKDKESSRIQCGAVTNSRGFFSIEVAEGNYEVTVEYVSYLKRKLNLSNINKSHHIGTVSLSVDVNALEEVEVVGEKRLVENKPNKMVYNVTKDVAAASGSISDIIANIPSVTETSEGTFKILGEDATIMINGKTSALSKQELLSTISAGSIERVEVISNPGAQYKASYRKIINIILKKGKNQGLNAAITATGGNNDYYGGLLLINQKSDNINFHAFTSYNSKQPTTISNVDIENLDNGNIDSYLSEERKFKAKTNNFTGNFGVDYYISKKATLSTTFTFSKINNKPENIATTYFYDANKNLVDDNIRNFNGEFDNTIYELNAEYDQQFTKEGHSFNTSIVYTKDVEEFYKSVLNTNGNFTNENYTTKGDMENVDIYATYKYPINDKSIFTLGYNGEFGSLPFTYSNNQQDVELSDKNNAAYTEYEYEDDKIYLGLGLRAEFNELDITYLNSNIANVKKEFNNLFPTVSLFYSFTDTKQIGFTYSTSIVKPTYYQYQIFEEKYSETSTFKGNENLDPIYVDNFQLSYNSYGSKLILIPALFYNIYKDYFQTVTYNRGEQINGYNKTLTTWANVGDVHYYGLNLSFMYNPTKNLTFNGTVLGYYFDQRGKFEIINTANETIIQDYTDKNFNGNLSLITQIKFPKLFKFQANFFHQLDSEGPVSRLNANTYLNAAISKELFNNKASISLSVKDVFKTRETNRDRFYPEYNSTTITKNKYRTILFSFTYKFNKLKKVKEIDFYKKDIKPNF